MPTVRVEPMTHDDVGTALRWAASEGWNPGLHDADTFLAADPYGFFVLKVDGQPAATVSAVRYGERFGSSSCTSRLRRCAAVVTVLRSGARVEST